MSKNTLRNDKTCLNCGAYVEDRFCPQCGQENTETRKSFHYLFTHFAEDLVHYDSGFWKTIKYLLFYPGKLTREYLSGRRKAYVAPVKLYIFISFITFFLAGFILDPHSIDNNTNAIKSTPSENKTNFKTLTQTDSLALENRKFNEKLNWFSDYKNLHHFDSLQNANTASKKMSTLQHWFTRKIVAIAETNTPKETLIKTLQSFKQNLPKVLFIYMPLFAFWLWLFHSKKRWFYFDHGIFSLHYFSFLLLTSSLLIILEWLLSLGDFLLFTILKYVLGIVFFIWPIRYFFRAHRLLYGESKLISFVKSSLLFWINFILIIILLGLYSVYSFITVK